MSIRTIKTKGTKGGETMSVRASVLAAATLLLVVRPQVATALEWYVDVRVAESGDGTTWETAFQKIQEGIDAASAGDTVIVGQGTYLENIDFAGKNIILTSTNPLEADIVAATIIDGNQWGPAVSFAGTEDESCTLSGFTIRNGEGNPAGGISGGTGDKGNRAGIENNVITQNSGCGLFWCNGVVRNNIVRENAGCGLCGCGGTIEDNTVTENWGEHGVGAGLHNCDGTIRGNTITGNGTSESGLGGGLAQCDGLIMANVIAGNTARHTGGLYLCHARIEGNTISHNSAKEGGGGLYGCDGLICNNTIYDNSSGREGGGLSRCDGRIQANIIAGNAGHYGGGLYECDGEIQGNTIADNQGGRYGGGLAHCDGRIGSNLITLNEGQGGGLAYCCGEIHNNTILFNRGLEGPAGYGIYCCDASIVNCIVWGNFAGATGEQIESSATPSFSCVQDWAGGGVGNIAEDPRFVDPDGRDGKLSTYGDNDYRLLPDSPCIDAGINGGLGPTDRDTAEMHRIMYGGKNLTVDMGAFEYYINRLEPGPRHDQTTLTWSSLGDRSYSVFYSENLLTWRLADDRVFSAGYTTTSWIDDGSRTGIAPALAPRRFYRILENP